VSRQVYVGLPVKDLETATRFYTELGFAYIAEASDDLQSCIAVTDDTFLMLNVESYFTEFTQSQVADPSTAREVTVGLAVDSREQVDDIFVRAVTNGGRNLGEPVAQGPMYMRAFLDPDGHRCSILHFASSAND
jgi:uncharacterized protein